MRNFGLENARGDLIAYLDHDDLWAENKLTRQVACMVEQPDLLYSITNVKFFLEPGSTLRPGFKRESFEVGQAGCTAGALLAKREAFRQIGMFDPDLPVGCDQDWFAPRSRCAASNAFDSGASPIQTHPQHEPLLGCAHKREGPSHDRGEVATAQAAEHRVTVTALSEGGAFPSRRQELLLKAALFQGQTALEAWGTWKAEFDLEKRLDAGSYRLLPLLYHNLARHGVDEPVMGKLKGIYRRAWYLNQTLFRDGVSVLRSLHAAGIETAVLKGAALSLLCYKDPGLRPMDDFDILVPNRKRRLAIEMLQRDGWTPFGASFESLTEAELDIRHSCGFRNANGRDVDLHWRVLSPYLAYPADEEDFWAGAVVLQIMGEPTLALNSTDNLLHICVHATNWQPVHPMRWISDAMLSSERLPPASIGHAWWPWPKSVR